MAVTGQKNIIPSFVDCAGDVSLADVIQGFLIKVSCLATAFKGPDGVG